MVVGSPFPRLQKDLETDRLIDGVLNVQFAQTLAKGKGKAHGIDASEAMIAAARKVTTSDAAAEKVCTFEGKLKLLSQLTGSINDGG